MKEALEILVTFDSEDWNRAFDYGQILQVVYADLSSKTMLLRAVDISFIPKTEIPKTIPVMGK